MMAGFVRQISPGLDPMDRRNGAITDIQMKPGHWQKQSGGQKQVMAVLPSHPAIDAAKSIGIADTTAALWMKTPEFQPAYREAMRQPRRGFKRPRNLSPPYARL